MADSIVERLREWDDGRISTHYEGCWDSHPVCAILFAADAIEARDAEIERLRAAGDAFAEWWHFGDIENLDEFTEAVLAWQEARRG